MQAHNITIDDLLNEADIMWKKSQSMIAAKGCSEETCDQVFDIIRKEHSMFAAAYPIVVRYMCQLGLYRRKAFKQYLINLQKNLYKTQDEYLDSQANYVVTLYRHVNSKWGAKDVARFRTRIRTMLQDEHDQFKSNVESIAKEIDEERDKYNEELRDDLKMLLRTL